MRQKKQIMSGVVLSYLLIFANMIYGLLITPFILEQVGDVDYGVYKTISSLSASLAVMDLGLGATMTRYMSRYHAEGKKEEANNFSAMIFIQYLVMTLVLGGIGVALYFSVGTFYSGTFNAEQTELAKTLLVFLLLNMILRLFENLLTGIASGCERFVVSNGVKLLSVILKFSLILVFLPLVKNVVLIVAMETVIVSLAILVLIVYIFNSIGLRPRLRHWDWSVFKESFVYTILMFIQTVTIQFNGNVDNILIGGWPSLGPEIVTMYSMALFIFGMYENLSGSIANIMLPSITKQVIGGESSMQLQRSVEKAGRFQFMILAPVLGGFAILGKEFFALWVGSEYDVCYYIALMLIIPVTFTMVQNVSLSILRAQNKMLYRTVTLAVSCVINVVVTVIGLGLCGYWGAAIGTMVSTISNLIFMNIYYKAKLGFKIISMFWNIMARIVPCAAVAALAVFVVHNYFYGSWMAFVFKVALFAVIYAVLMFVIGLKSEDKSLLFGRFLRRRKK